MEFPGVDLNGLNNVEISPNGEWLLASTGASATVALFAVDAAGDLSSGPIAVNGAQDAMSVPYAGLGQSTDAVFSPDGAHVYVVSPVTDSLATLSLDSGMLLMAELEQEGTDDPLDAGPEVTGLTNPEDVLVSADGNHVYVAASGDSAITHFTRDSDSSSGSFGRLSFVASYTDALEPALDSVNRIFASSDGTALYAGVGPDRNGRGIRCGWQRRADRGGRVADRGTRNLERCECAGHERR